MPKIFESIRRKARDILRQLRPSPRDLRPFDIINLPAVPVKENLVNLEIIVSLDGEKHRRHEQLLWLSQNSYANVKECIYGVLSAACEKKETPGRKGMIDHGTVRLMGRPETSDRDVVMDHEQLQFHEDMWADRIPVMIAKFIGAHDNVPFNLKMQWVFTSVPAITNDPAEVSARLLKAMTTNWRDQKYLPKSQLERLLQPDQVEAIIQTESPDRAATIDWVINFALRLLALCICAKVKNLFETLQIFRISSLEDASLPLKEAQRPEAISAGDFDSMRMFQSRFSILELFQEGPEDNRLLGLHVDKDITVPLHFDKDIKLGSGGYGVVHSASIHEEYHNLVIGYNIPAGTDTEPVEDDGQHLVQPFAVKRFGGDQSAKDAYMREETALKFLMQIPSDANINIVTHLASWTDHESSESFIIFPRAKSSLEAFLRSEPPRTLTKAYTLWILEQLLNLTKGTERIHRGRSPSEQEHPDSGSSLLRDFGYHHDLKPSNILIFDDDGEGRWKISDFGNAKMYKWDRDDSQRTPNLTFGDPKYAAPEFEMKHETGRAYDVWSLGCIFVEVLVWLFWSRDGEGLAKFRENRKNDNNGTPPASFWCKDKDPGSGFRLRPSVEQILDVLIERTQDLAFQDVVNVARRMLTIDPETRPQALSARDDMESAILTARFILRGLLGSEKYLMDGKLIKDQYDSRTTAPVRLPQEQSASIIPISGPSRSQGNSSSRPNSWHAVPAPLDFGDKFRGAGSIPTIDVSASPNGVDTGLPQPSTAPEDDHLSPPPFSTHRSRSNSG